MYEKIYDFCKVRNFGNIYYNQESEPTPRVKFLMELLHEMSIDYVLDKFSIDSWGKNITGYNIIMKGNSGKMVVAHHDIVNPNIDNANDNSASVINAIMVKKLRPDINVVLLDGEETGGIGAKRLAEQINLLEFGNIDWVLNLELTGIGGEDFFIGNYPGKLFDHIKSKFNCPVYNTPFNDSVTLRRFGIDSCVINPLPKLNEGLVTDVYSDNGYYLDSSILRNCHSKFDTIDSIDVNDMKIFVENVILKILD